VKVFTAALFILCLMASTASAEKRVVYSKKVTTSFKWKWPLQTVRETQYVQKKDYYYMARLLDLSKEDVSKYRFYYNQKTAKNDWGYFFKSGDKLAPKQIIQFGPAQPQHKTSGAARVNY
jgi:hypothetical protein